MTVVPVPNVAVHARGVTRSFGGRDVLRELDISIAPGEFVALLGRSGTGKSTLLRVLGGLDPDYRGEVLVPRRRAVVFQEPRLLPWQRVLPNVALGLKPIGPNGGGRLRQRSLDALREVGLADHASAWPVTLSGGEAQRVALARALVREPQLMLLDEPFGALDALTRTRMHALLQELCARHNPAVLLVTHDVDEAILLADRVLVLVDGAIPVDLPVTIPRPRDRGHSEFGALRTRLLAELGVTENVTARSPSPALLLPLKLGCAPLGERALSLAEVFAVPAGADGLLGVGDGTGRRASEDRGDRGFGGAGGERCPAGHRCGQVAHGGIEIFGCDHPADDPPSGGVGSIEGRAGQEDFGSGGRAGRGDQLADARVGIAHPEACRGNGEAGVSGGDPDVGSQGEEHARAHAGTADHRDNRRRDAEHRVTGCRRALGSGTDLADVGAGGEGAVARTPQHDDAHLGVLVEDAQVLAELGEHGR